jgi:hypothetical protein
MIYAIISSLTMSYLLLTSDKKSSIRVRPFNNVKNSFITYTLCRFNMSNVVVVLLDILLIRTYDVSTKRSQLERLIIKKLFYKLLDHNYSIIINFLIYNNYIHIKNRYMYILKT